MKLIDAQIGEKFFVSNIDKKLSLQNYLQVVGFVAGSEVAVLHKSIFKKIFLVSVKNSVVSLKADILKYIDVRKKR